MNRIVDINREQEMASILHSHLYNTVHGRPYSDHRHNIELYPMFDGPKTSIVNINSCSIRLPASGRWFIYGMNCPAISMVKLPLVHTWTSLEDYGNTHKVDIRLILHETRRMIPRGSVYVLKNPKQSNFLFAFRKDDILPVMPPGSSEETMTIRMNIYYHGRDSGFRIRTFRNMGRLSVRDAFEEEITSAQTARRQVYVNGLLTFVQDDAGRMTFSMKDLPGTAICEIVDDDTIIGSLDYDSGQTEYLYKGKDNQTRMLVHIPKDWNPDREFLTRDMVDVFVMRDDGTYVYVDRTSTERDFGTITHQDIGICKTLIDKYHIDGKVKVYVHRREDGAQPWKDADHRLTLYHLSDELILNNLLGKGLPEWSAANLEGTRWTYLVDNGYHADHPEPDMKTMLQAYGYLNSADALCRRSFEILITEEMSNPFIVPIPICYLGTNDIRIHVFVKGRLLDTDHCHCEREYQFIRVTIDPEYFPEVGEVVAFELFEGTPLKGREFDLDVGESKTLSVDQEILIYREMPISSVNKISDHRLYKRMTYQTSVREFTPAEMDAFVSYEEQEDGSTWVTLHNVGQEAIHVFIVSKYGYAKLYGVEEHLKDKNYDIWCTSLLKAEARYFPFVEGDVVEEIDPDDVSVIPYFNRENPLLVYMNGRELTKGLDYEVYPILTSLSAIAGQFVVIQNSDYLRMVDNTIEVYTVGEEQVALDTGFTTRDTTETFEAFLSYYPEIGSVFADGKLIPKPEDRRTHVDMPTARIGASYKIRAMIPRLLKDFLDQYGEPNIRLQNRVLSYMKSVEDIGTDLVVTGHTHKIYSIYFQTIIEDVLRGKLKVNPKWTANAVRRILEPYEDLKAFDIVFRKDIVHQETKLDAIETPETGIDLRFVDTLPTYRVTLWDVTDLEFDQTYPMVIISGSNEPTVNGNYLCINGGSPSYMMDVGPRHKNEEAYRQWANMSSWCRIGHVDGYWRLYDINEFELYRAYDPVGREDYWNRSWTPSKSGLTRITMETRTVEVSTMNELPAHRFQYTTSKDVWMFLERIVRMMMPADLIRDRTT